MKAYYLGEPTGSFIKGCVGLRKRWPWIFWPAFPFMALLVVLGVYGGRAMVRVGLMGLCICHSLGFDPLDKSGGR